MPFKGEGAVIGGAANKSKPTDGHSTTSSSTSMMHTAIATPVNQPEQYRDVTFAILFLTQLAGVVATAIWGAPSVLQATSASSSSNDSTTSTSIDATTSTTYGGITFTDGPSMLIFVTTLFGAALTASILCFIVMAKYAKTIVQVSFFATPTAAILAALVWTVQNKRFDAPVWYTVAGITVMAGLLYFFSRQYIPFAASNLHTALTALTAHKGLFGLALLSALLVYVWFAIWSIASAGLYLYYESLDPPIPREVPCIDDPYRVCTVQDRDYQPVYVAIGMLLSFYWTTQVLQNILHTTTAGAIGAWWFEGKSTDIMGSLYRSCTLSLGSICLGSLVVAVVQTLERVLTTLAANKRSEDERRQRDDSRRRRATNNGGFLVVILKWLRKITEYLNSWAFVYVGLYGYTYVTAGKTVASLFWQNGWSTFVSDRLVYRVLGLAKVGIALLSGALTMAIQTALGYGSTDDSAPLLLFLAGSIFGYLLSSTSLFVVESAVRTIIVCFAESPADLERTQPALYRELQKGWSQTYPKAWAERRDSNGAYHAHAD
mmetsp:Transcript_481/g.783  ORF Transcript_481/g.783 Transcript_481/m.783 type:complete len:546 (+) Transcript_481:129-1766(+)|eukprot:CAMPEP_0119020008 /NCGR_PEP_ID=MMETSP1176-20130426/23140_1 /TAXON_ID=265551 /ORGANISM="Synedropsis recta cf, Strain CCMP1620" /LENGTH=545 /DNA_ID=CAMNT_0006974363 /DNA_START=21 /DNA_END=1658 /DNA_ORIENTATION=-